MPMRIADTDGFAALYAASARRMPSPPFAVDFMAAAWRGDSGGDLDLEGDVETDGEEPLVDWERGVSVPSTEGGLVKSNGSRLRRVAEGVTGRVTLSTGRSGGAQVYSVSP